MPRMKKDKKMTQQVLFEQLNKLEEKEKEGQEPATELMKVIAEKIPSKKKIKKDFSLAEQAEIFAKIDSERKNVSGFDAIEQEKQKIKDEEWHEHIRDVKKIAKNMEIGNKSKIIIFPSYSRNSRELTWYKMGDFSALYYAYRMVDRMGRNFPKLQKDKDRYYKMKVIVSITNIGDFINRAMKLKEFEKHEETLDKIHILYLEKGLSDEELALLRRTGEMRKEMMHNVLRPKRAMPEMCLTILMLGRQVMAMNQKLERTYRYEIGDKVMEDVVKLLEIYYDYTGQLLDVVSVKDVMTKIVYRMRAEMSLIGENGAVEPGKICAIGETIVKIELLINEMK